MEDCHDLCKVTHFAAKLDPRHTYFNLSVRRYRHAHPWLRHNLTERDYFDRLSNDQTTIFYGLRTNPDDKTNNFPEKVAIISHMGGKPAQINIGDLLELDLTKSEQAPSCLDARSLGREARPGSHRFYGGVPSTQWRIAIATPGLKFSNKLSEFQDLELRDGQGLLLEKIVK